MFISIAGTVRLSEAGKKIAKRNAARLRAAIAAMQEMLGEVDAEEAEPGDAGRDLAEAMLRKSDTLDARREGVRKAIREQLTDPMRPDVRPWVWVRDIFDAAVVVESDDEATLTQYPYSVDSTVDPPRYIIGEGAAVQLAYVPVPGQLAEAALDEPFLSMTLEEKAIRADGSATIKVINQGWGSSGYYPKAVLERDGPKVFTAGTKMYADHPTAQEEADRPERSIKELAAVFTGNARWEEAGPDGAGLYAEAKVYDAWRKPIDDMAADIGVSIRALGRGRMGEAEGRKGLIVESLVAARSVDFVTDPGRGGKILPLSEAARQRNGGPAPAAPSRDKQEGATMLTEAEQNRVNALEESVRTLTTQNQRMAEAGLVRDAREYAGRTLAGLNLPEVTKTRLAESLALRAIVKDGALDREAFAKVVTEAAKAEGQYLADAGGLGHIRGLGESVQRETAEEPKAGEVEGRMAESFKALGLSEDSAKVAAQGRN